MSARGRGGAWLDRFGACLAMACALHCAALPVLLAALPSLTLALLSWQDPRHRWAMRLLQASRWEWAVVLAALAVAVVSLAIAWRRHRDARPVLLLATAASLFLSALASADLVAHAAFAVLGGVALAAAHLLNLGLARRATRAG